MKKPIVLLDVDEVLADFVGRVLELVRRITGRNVTREEITCWDIAVALKLTPEEAAEKARLIKEPGFCAGLEPLPGAIDGVREIREYADVRAVTSPFKSKTWASEREEWLCEHFGFRREQIVQTPGKDIVFGDVLIDDKLETCQNWQARWRESTAILFSCPWNQDRGWSGEYTRGWGRQPHLPTFIRRCVDL